MKRIAVVLTLGLLGALGASATLITVLPFGGTTITFPDDQGDVTHPTASSGSAAGFSIVSTVGSAVYPYAGSFNLDQNGTWDNGLIGDSSGVTVLTIDLGGLYSSVGGTFNYNTTGSPEGPSGAAPFIAALDAGQNVLEMYVLSIVAPIDTAPGSLNAGEFRGIDLGSPLIAYLQFGGSGMVMHDITLSDVPEPSTAWLAVLGLGVLGWRTHRRRR